MRAKSTAELRLAGTFRDDRHGERIDEIAATGRPRKPDWLKGEAGRAWDFVVSSMAPGVLAKADSLVLAGACEWWSEWREYRRKRISGEGDPYKLLVMAATAWKQFMVCAAKLGLSPVDRTKLRDMPETEQQPDAKTAFFTGAG
jgi:phage terminase small subunit